MILLALTQFVVPLLAPDAQAGCPEMAVEDIIAFAKTGIGSPYVWGGGKWDADDRSWGGADCSGFAAKVWEVPSYVPATTYSHPYYTGSIVACDDYWSWVSWADMQQGDWFVYNSGDEGHVGVVDKPDAWGSIVSYEAMGTDWGIVHANRTLASYYDIAHRDKIVEPDRDGDGLAETDGDCNDDNAAVYPGAPEVCDGLDDDCNGMVDDSPVDGTAYWADADGDTWGDAAATTLLCSPTPGWVTNDADCDDTNAAINPGAIELCDDLDNDCEGGVDEGYDADADGVRTCAGDCDDADAGRHAGAAEAVDGIDNDCDWNVDEASDVYDDDHDGWTEDAGDCNDANAFVFPGAPEVADGQDDNCDGAVDEHTAAVDDDGDGYTEASGETNGGDCDDADPDVFPGSAERANGVDDNCDGNVDRGTENADDDGDSWSERDGDCDDANRYAFPSAPEVLDSVDNNCDGTIDDHTDAYDDDDDGYAEQDGDCDDADPSVHPFAIESADDRDEDCDHVVDNGTRRFDDDHDGWAEDARGTDAGGGAEADGGRSLPGDCDDANPLSYPGAPERLDGRDNNCDGRIDDNTTAFDDDSDGWSESMGDCDDTRATSWPGAPETLNGVDDDCDRLVDDQTTISDDDGDGWTEADGDCDDDRASVRPGAFERVDGVDNDCDGVIEQPVGWACATGSPEHAGLAGALAGIALLRRRKIRSKNAERR